MELGVIRVMTSWKRKEIARQLISMEMMRLAPERSRRRDDRAAGLPAIAQRWGEGELVIGGAWIVVSADRSPPCASGSPSARRPAGA
jgi:hypothetical protein